MTGSARRPALTLLLGALVLAIAGCGGNADASLAIPVASIGPSRAVSPAVAQTRVELVRVLAAHSLVLTDTQAPVRPAEAPFLAAAPRAVYQVVLPKDPSRGFIVVYDFADQARAADAAAQQQAYIASGPGRVQTTSGTITIIRQVGPTIVLYEWLPDASKDPTAAGIQTALESLGVGYPVAG